MLTVFNQFHGVTNAEFAALNHVAVQGKLAVEFPHDFLKHATVLLLIGGIKRGHYAAHTEVLNPDNDLPDAQALAGPRALSQATYTSNHNVRPEPSAVMAEGFDSVIGCH